MFWYFFHPSHFISVFFNSVLILPLKILYCFYIEVLISEAYSEPCQASKIELFVKIVNGLKPIFLQKNFIQIFGKVLNTYLDGGLLQLLLFRKISHILSLWIGYRNEDQFFFSKSLFMKIFFIEIFFRFTFSKGLIYHMV